MCATPLSHGCSRAAAVCSCSAANACSVSRSGHCAPADLAAGCADMALRSLPDDAALRVVGDVHGDAVAFGYAAATDRFVVQLGDLTDYGPDNAGALRLMFRLIDEGRGLFLLGNHDLKLARSLAGEPVRSEATLDATLAQLDAI